MIGTTISHYKIVEKIGQGGMGEVYLAEDTRLERKVALKVLPAEVAADPDRLARFEREAKTISQLTHSHICTLHDVGQEGDVHFLVMEYLEGESLAERLQKEKIPFDEALQYSIEIADALDAAHRQGVVHRDLKPGNIMLTRDGAKLLDFGLAKLQAPGTIVAESVLATEDKPLTQEGTILGTFQYMAPEQLEGKEADPRTDIFSFGAVVYEMLTGRRAFSGDSSASLIGAIMHEAPQPVSDLQPMTPPGLDRIVQTCLAKDPEDRWQTSHDLMLEMKWMAEGGSAAGLPAPTAARRKTRERLAWLIAAAAVVAAMLATVGYILRAPEAPRITRFQIQAPEELNFVDNPRISPDGRVIAFRGTDENGDSSIWIRPLDILEARSLAGTDGIADSRPIWSPDSRQIAFFAGGKLKKVAIDGGSAQTICDADGADGSWSAAGEILFDEHEDLLHRVSAAGGVPKPVVDPETDEGVDSVGWPEFLPDSRRFLYLAHKGSGESWLMLGELGSDDTSKLVAADSRAQFVEPGYLFYVRENTLVAHPFDASAGELIGDPRPIADDVAAAITGHAPFTASRNGTLVYRSEVGADRQLVWFDRSGQELGIVGTPAPYGNPWLLPGGDRLVVDAGDALDENSDLWIHDLERGVASRFTFDPGMDACPVVSPDAKRIVFSSNRGGSTFDLWIKSDDGTSNAEELLAADQDLLAADWSRDGRYLLYQRFGSGTLWNIWAMPMDGSGEPFPVVQTEFIEGRPSFSPDARWIAYQSNESGQDEIYVLPFPSPGGKWQVSTEGGSDPHWSQDGREIFYLDAAERLMSVGVQTAPTFRAGLPETLFETRLDPITVMSRYLVTPDAQRFLMLSRLGNRPDLPTTVVMNWPALLEQ